MKTVFAIVAALATTALAVPADLNVRGGYEGGACCPYQQRYQCQRCGPNEGCPRDRPDRYQSCSDNTQVGVANVLVCNVLNDNDLNVPIQLDLL